MEAAPQSLEESLGIRRAKRSPDADLFHGSGSIPPKTARNLKSLEAELSAFLNPIEEGGERELLFSRLVPHYPRSDWDGVGTEVLREKILLCGKAIEAYVRNTRAKGTSLHVLGM